MSIRSLEGASPQRRAVRVSVGLSSRVDRINAHRNAVINECVARLRRHRSDQIGMARGILKASDETCSSMQEIANNVCMRIGRDEIWSFDEDEWINNHEYEQFLLKIMEEVELEIQREESTSDIDESALPSIEDFVEPIDDGCSDMIICPSCRKGNLYLDQCGNRATCQNAACVAQFHLPSFGGLEEFRHLLSQVFDRHYICCSSIARRSNEPLQHALESFSVQYLDSRLHACCRACGFYEVL